MISSLFGLSSEKQKNQANSCFISLSPRHPQQHTQRHRHMLSFSLSLFVLNGHLLFMRKNAFSTSMHVCVYMQHFYSQLGACMWLCNPHPRIHTQHTSHTDRPTEKKEKRKHHIIQTIQILVVCILPPFLSLTHALSTSSDLTRKNDNLSWILSHDHPISRSFYIFSLFIISRI